MFTLISVLIFAVISNTPWNNAPSTRHEVTPTGFATVEAMPKWMAIGVGTLFALIGVSQFVVSALDIQSKRAGIVIAMSIMAYFMGFFDVVCIHGALSGTRFSDIPFLPVALNAAISWAIWGSLILLFSAFAIGCTVRIFSVSCKANKPL